VRNGIKDREGIRDRHLEGPGRGINDEASYIRGELTPVGEISIVFHGIAKALSASSGAVISHCPVA
jgi:hypothetical protein